MITPAYIRTMALYNSEMNRRVYAAAAKLSDEQRPADRGLFWKSLHGTLCHLMWADRQWMSRFRSAGAKLVGEIAATHDPERLADLAHKLKGAARAAGALRLGDLAAALEHSRSAADIPAIVAEWTRVEAALAG